MAELKVGDQIPDFELYSDNGEKIRTSEVVGKGPVVLYFYPKDNTPICTIESCAFRDEYEYFTMLGAEVFGISADSIGSHESFKDKLNLPFKLLSDADNAVRQAFGVKDMLGMLPGRKTFVVDKDGIIRHIIASNFRAKKHVMESLQYVRTLVEEAKPQ